MPLTITPPIARILQPAEWGRLDGTDLAALPPEASTVVVVEVDGAVVARWAAMQVVHVEGLWIDPAYAGHAGVGRALLTAMVGELRAAGVEDALTQVETPDVAAMCEKVGGRVVPGQTWVIPIAPKE